jgi:hypothetical protein
MAPSEWDQVVDLFHAALEKSGHQRVVLLDEACGTQTLLRKAVEELLREHESSGSFLSEPLLQGQLTARCPVFAPNQRFEQFILEDMLGRGGMGEVWSAHDSELDRSVALKFLRAETASALDTGHIAREAKAASALNHPNIVTIHEVVRSERCSAIIMELVQGSSLAKLRGTSLPVEDVLSILFDWRYRGYRLRVLTGDWRCRGYRATCLTGDAEAIGYVFNWRCSGYRHKWECPKFSAMESKRQNSVSAMSQSQSQSQRAGA